MKALILLPPLLAIGLTQGGCSAAVGPSLQPEEARASLAAVASPSVTAPRASRTTSPSRTPRARPTSTLTPRIPSNLGDSVDFVSAQQSFLLVGDTSGILTLLDTSDPAHPAPLSNVPLGTENVYVLRSAAQTLPAQVRDALVVENRLYIITVTNLIAFEITDPSRPRELMRLPLGERLNDIELRGDEFLLLTADTRHDRVLVSVLDPANSDPLLTLRQAELPDMAVGRARLAGDLAYVTIRELEAAQDLRLFDIRNPSAPVDLGQVNALPAFRAWIIGETAYVATGRIYLSKAVGPITEVASLAIVDVADPTSPSITGYIWTEDFASDLATQGELFFIIGNHGQAWTDRNMDPELGYTGPKLWFSVAKARPEDSPVVIRSLDLPGTAEMMDLLNGYAYVAAGEGGLHIVNASAAVLDGSLIGDQLKAT